MESDLESLPDQDMSSHSSSSRASTPTQPENFYSTCQKKKLIELELKTYTDSIDHTQILIKNLERQGLQNHPIYTNNCKMIQGLIHQRELLTGAPAPTKGQLALQVLWYGRKGNCRDDDENGPLDSC
ncbi:hypothetical protein NPIL_309351 [Nephila pilipes]|uniref:Uncharacterized protein n=1 Tax=Nephila pilipes TaxID=299642 RepID=A0A8X6UFN8_NEPPI|nr:hypothetical protein NPIL_309351 [Nephila pilipes]